MPYVNVKIAGTLTDEQKRKIAEQVTDTMQHVAGKSPQYTYVVIEEVPRSDWAIGGRLLADQ